MDGVMHAVEGWAHNANVRLDLLKTMDPLQMTWREHTVCVLSCAMCWGLLEVLLHVLCRGALYAWLYPCGVPLHDKGRRRASADVTAGISKLVANVFNLVCLPMAIAVLMDPAVSADSIYGHSSLSVGLCIVSAGYFLYDLAIVTARLSTEGAAFLLHACCCVFAFCYATYSFYLTYFGAAFLMWEFSTPFVHLRWFLLKAGKERSRAYLVNGLVMAATFFACRPLWGTYMSYKFFIDTQAELNSPRPNGFPASGIWGYRIANVCLNGLNYLWFSKIAAKVFEALSRGGRKGKGGKAR